MRRKQRYLGELETNLTVHELSFLVMIPNRPATRVQYTNDHF